MPRHTTMSEREFTFTRVVETTAGAAPYLEGMEAGWTQSLERLQTHVTSSQSGEK